MQELARIPQSLDKCDTNVALSCLELSYCISCLCLSLFRTIITNKENALCCDRKEAVYYLEESDSDDWLIFFEGGGGCTTVEQCNERYSNENTTILMTAEPLKEERNRFIDGRDLLSSDAKENPLFHDFNRVLVPYCSQDAFLANSSLPTVDIGHIANISFVFRGRVILQSVIQDLLDLGMNDAARVVLAGSSAGGVGVLNNLEWIQGQLNVSTDLSLIIDSSWFIPFNDYHAINFSPEEATLYGIEQPLCFDHSSGYPCCTSLVCLLTNDDYIQQQLPHTFFITSLYDIFTLEESLKDIVSLLDFTASAEISDQDFLRIFNSYGALMNSTLLETFSHPSNQNVSIFAPSCIQHVYLATSSLWDENELLYSTIDGSFTEGVFRLTNPVQSGQWDTVMINMTVNESRSVSLHSALQEWYNDRSEQVFYADVCKGPTCGQCPGNISLEFTYVLWDEHYNIVVLIVSSILAATPLLIKMCLYFCMKRMLYRQKVYNYNLIRTLKNKPKFPKAVHAVSVSCTNLSYHLDTAENHKKPGTDYNEAAQIHHSHHRLSALTNTVLPCCKPLCHRYNAPVGDSEVGQTTNSVRANSGMVNGLRPDSGISSSIVSNPLTKNGMEYSDSTSMDFILESRSPAHSTAYRPPPQTASQRKKVILRQVNMYVNPGELLAIMGPSGSGKTTLLDVLLGRRRTGHVRVSGSLKQYILWCQYVYTATLVIATYVLIKLIDSFQ